MAKMRAACLGFLAGALLAAALPPLACAADDKDPQAAFDEVYGNAFRAAIASVGKDDDTALAKQLAESLRSFELPVPLVKVMADKACELAERSPAASLHADDALAFLASKQPAEAGAVEAKAVSVLEKAYIAAARDTDLKKAVGDRLLVRLVPLADRELKEKKVDQAIGRLRIAQNLAREANDTASFDAIHAKLDAALDIQRRQSEIDLLEKKIEANPNDADARKKLVQIHLVDRDDPAAAAFFVNDKLDETTRRLVPVAAKDAAGADVKVLADLGSWYMDLANEAPDAARPAMLKRSADYFQRFLKDYQANDLLKAKATLSLEQVNKKLAAAGGTAAAITPGTPTTPQTPATPPAGAGELTVKIDGPAITEPDKVESLFQQFWRGVAKNYVTWGGEYAPFTSYNARFPSSKGMTTTEAREKMTTFKIERTPSGLTRKVPVVPQPGEVEAVAMALEKLEVGQYGYIHSAEVVEVVGPEELIVEKVWLVDTESLAGANYDDRKERDNLARRQSEWAWSKAKVRILGQPTLGLKPAMRIGMTGAKGRPLQIAIVAIDTRTKADFFARRNYVAATIAKLLKNDLEEKQFLELLSQRGLTKTDFVNIYLEARRGSSKDFVETAIKRVEARGAK